MSIDCYAVVVLIAGCYAITRERGRLTASTLLLVGLWILYGAGYFYYTSQAETWDHVTSRVTLCLGVMWFGVILGMEFVRTFAHRAIRRQNAVTSGWDASPISGSTDRQIVLIAWFLCGALIAGFIVFGRLQQIGEFLSAATEVERREMRFAFNASGSYAYNVVLAVFAPFVCFYLLVQWIATRRQSLAVACAALACAIVLCKFATFQKLPWVFFLLQLFMAHKLARQLSMSFGWFIVTAALGVIALGFAASIAYPEIDVPAVGNYLLYRIAFITNEGLYQTLYIYPDYLPHTAGYNVGLIQSLFGQVAREPAHTVVADFFGAHGATFNALFIADAWVDFGLPGVLLAGILVGAFVKLSDVFYFQFGKSPLCIAGVVASTWAIMQLLSTAAPTAFLSGGLVLLPVTIFTLRSRPHARHTRRTELQVYSERPIRTHEAI